MTAPDWRAKLGAQRKERPHRHKWHQGYDVGDGPVRAVTACITCNAIKDPAKSRQGRNNRSRGLAIQRKVLAAMDLENIPYNKPGHDGRSRGENGLHVAEVKSGAQFSGRRYELITAIPAKGGQARWLVEVETPGPGKKARVLVTTVIEDWQGLFVGGGDDE